MSFDVWYSKFFHFVSQRAITLGKLAQVSPTSPPSAYHYYGTIVCDTVSFLCNQQHGFLFPQEELNSCGKSLLLPWCLWLSVCCFDERIKWGSREGRELWLASSESDSCDWLCWAHCFCLRRENKDKLFDLKKIPTIMSTAISILG